MNRFRKHDYFPYTLLSLIATTLFMLLLLDRRFPIFNSPSSMVPFLFIVFAIASILGRYATSSSALPVERTEELWVPWYRMGIVGGSLTGLIFLVTYWAYDWPAPNRVELSERRITEMCGLDYEVPQHLIQSGVPDPMALVLPCVLISMMIGLVVGITFPRWHRQLNKLANVFPSLRFMASPYPSGLIFGLVFGAAIGTWLCGYFFSFNDGRPLIRISTSAVSTFLAIGFYLLFEIARHRDVMTKTCYLALTNVLVIGALLTGLAWLIDAQLEVSANAYCLFYSEWDTETNQLRAGIVTRVTGAFYGGVIGAIVMSVASGYLVIRTIIHVGTGKSQE